MNCPHCGCELTPHDAQTGVKVGAMHCYECGCCFLADGLTPRDGVPVCAQAESSFSPSPEEPAASVQPEPTETPEVEPRRRNRK